MAALERSGSEDGEMLYKMSQAYAQLGDSPSSVRLFRRSVEQNFHPYTYFLRDPLLKPIRACMSVGFSSKARSNSLTASFVSSR